MKIYIAGPDVFRPDAAEHFNRARQACAARGHTALCPVDSEPTHDAATLYRNNIALIRQADAVIANLNPFRGPEPDSGTVWEVGFALGIGKPVIGYLSEDTTLLDRVEQHYGPIKHTDCGAKDRDGLAIENFGLPLNLMLAHSVNKLVIGSLEDALSQLT